MGALTVANSTLAGTGAAVASATLSIGADEVQTISVDATNGSFNLSFNGATTASLAINCARIGCADGLERARPQ